MNDVLCALGHVASRQSLTSRGISAGQLRRAVTTGLIQRLRRGVCGCGHLDERIARAAAIGGAVTCVSVLRAHGVRAGHSLRLHTQLPPTSSAMPDPTARLHWALPRFGLRSPGEATPLQSLWQALHCLDEENAIAAMESAMWTGFCRPEQIRQLALHAPRRLHDGIRRMVTNSGSGNETIVRLRLERAGFTVVAQGPMCPAWGTRTSWSTTASGSMSTDGPGTMGMTGSPRTGTAMRSLREWGVIHCASAPLISQRPGRTLSR